MSSAGYARTQDGLAIAYRSWGDKAPVHVFVSEVGSSVDTRDMHPSFLRLWRQLGAISRVVALDRRNTGASESALPYAFADLDQFVLDILAVVEATGADQVVLTGAGSCGAGAVAFALAYPDRVARLCLFNSTAKATRSADYPIAQFSDEEIADLAQAIPHIWGTGAVLAQFAPALAADATFMEVCGRVERLACTPSAFQAFVASASDLDIRHLVDGLTVPTLVYFTGDTLQVNREQCVDLARRIPGATFADVAGDLFFQPDGGLQLDVLAQFIGGSIDADPTHHATLVFLDVVSSTTHAARLGDAAWTQALDDLDAFVRTEVARHGGRVVNFTGDGHVALFDATTPAVETALRLAGGVSALGLALRLGVHSGEVTTRKSGDVSGLAVHMGARVLSAAASGEVLVTRSVTTSIEGGAFAFVDRGDHRFKGFDGSHRLFACSRAAAP